MAKTSNLPGYGSRTWTTKDGRVLRWCDMDVSHLKNTADMLDRNAVRLLDSSSRFSSMVHGEQASIEAEHLADAEAERAGEMAGYAKQMRAYAQWRASRALADVFSVTDPDETNWGDL